MEGHIGPTTATEVNSASYPRRGAATATSAVASVHGYVVIAASTTTSSEDSELSQGNVGCHTTTAATADVNSASYPQRDESSSSIHDGPSCNTAGTESCRKKLRFTNSD